MSYITHLKITRQDGTPTHAPAVSRLLRSTLGIKSTRGGWRVAQSGDYVTLTSVDPYAKAEPLTRRLSAIGVEVNKMGDGGYRAVGFRGR